MRRWICAAGYAPLDMLERTVPRARTEYFLTMVQRLSSPAFSPRRGNPNFAERQLFRGGGDWLAGSDLDFSAMSVGCRFDDILAFVAESFCFNRLLQIRNAMVWSKPIVDVESSGEECDRIV
jgi:hypothetical protein